MRLRILALVALVLVAVVGWLWMPRETAHEAPDEVAPPRSPTVESPREGSRAERAPIPASGEALPVAPAAGPEIRGTVVDPEGHGLGGLRIRESADDAEGPRSGPDGSFAIRPVAEEWLLSVDEADWTTLRPAAFDDAPTPEGPRIVAARACAVDGRVVDRGGRALPGARIEFSLDAASWTASAGFEGRFRAEALPAIHGLRAAAALPGWRTAERVLDLPATEELRFVLDRDDEDALEIEGDVVHADGSPAANALVAFGAARTRTDARGTFRLVCGWFDRGTPLVAVERGLQPAVLDGYGAILRGSPGARPPERLVLPGRARTIEGRVVTARGAACKGFTVHLLGATALDPGGRSHDTAEVEAGGSLRSRTDAQGRFRFGGLCDRSYGILAVGARRAGRGVVLREDIVGVDPQKIELVVSEDRAPIPIRGRVRTSSGAPVGGARVALGRAVPPGMSGEFGRIGGRDAIAAPDGRFDIPEAPDGLVFLVVTGDGLVPSRFELVPGTPRDAVDLLVHERREVHIDAARASPLPDAVHAVDDTERAVPLWGAGATTPPTMPPMMPMGLAPLNGGDSGRLVVGDDARWLVLFRGSRELARIPLPQGTTPVDLVWP